MRVYKFISIAVMVTIMAVGYVHQRVEIVKSGYNLQKNKKYLSYLVDQNSNLMYNLSKLESPQNLLTFLDSEDVEFAKYNMNLPKNFKGEHSEAVGAVTVDKSSLFGRILDLVTLNAEARTGD